MSKKEDFVTPLIKQFSGQKRSLTIQRAYIDWTGDIVAALILSQMIWWADKTDDPDGWFAKSYDDWTEELGVSKYQVSKAVKERLKKFGVETKVKKSPFHQGQPTLHYRMDWKKFTNRVQILLTSESKETSLPKVKKLCALKIKKLHPRPLRNLKILRARARLFLADNKADTELINKTDNNAAVDLLISIGMDESVAKDFGARFGLERIQAVSEAAQDKNNPPGWARDALEKNWEVVKKVTAEVELDGMRYISGKYADFIHH